MRHLSLQTETLTKTAKVHGAKQAALIQPSLGNLSFTQSNRDVNTHKSVLEERLRHSEHAAMHAKPADALELPDSVCDVMMHGSSVHVSLKRQ